MQLRKSIVMSALAFGLAVPGSVVFAAEQMNSDTETVESKGIDRSQAVTIAERKLAGTTTRAISELGRKKSVWKVRIISTDGTKRGDFRIDGKTGDILKMNIKNIHTAKVKSATVKVHVAKTVK